MTLLCDTEAGILVPLGASSSIRDPVLGDLGARIVDRLVVVDCCSSDLGARIVDRLVVVDCYSSDLGARIVVVMEVVVDCCHTDLGARMAWTG